MQNALYCGDNLDVLRRYFLDETVDLIYLDPPFKSDQNYNLLFQDKSGQKSASQILAFEDTWEWNQEAQKNLLAVIERGGKLGQIMELFRAHLGENDMLAYLAMMAPRLAELHRVLKPSGSLYLHCDPTASHYLKILLDSVFNPRDFRNEIVWKRSHAHNSAKRFGCNHDILLFYSKVENPTWNPVFQTYDPNYLTKHYRHTNDQGRRYKHENPTGAGISRGVTGEPWRGIDPTVKGRHWARTPEELERLDAQGLIHWPKKEGAWPYIKIYLDERNGTPAQDTWADIDPINMMAKERLGYPTQKPQALLERIINASSNAGDVVLDPFCGCGTTIEAAQKLNRRWIGIDITIRAINVIRHERLPKLPESAAIKYSLVYRPRDIHAAAAFAAEQPFAFQDWAVEMLDGVPARTRSGDRGVDGRLYFQDEPDGSLRQIIVSVKGGKLKSTFVRELQGAVARERAAMGILLTLHEPSKAMLRDIASSGVYSCSLGTFPKTQFVTVTDLLSNTALDLPPIRKMDETKKRAMAAAEGQLRLPGVG